MIGLADVDGFKICNPECVLPGFRPLDTFIESRNRLNVLFKHLQALKQGYHTVTIAMYMNELIKRVDPKHRPLHQFFKEELAEPLGKYTQSP